MRRVILVRYGEIGTKFGRTRHRFIRRLIDNIRRGLNEEGIELNEIRNRWSRIVVEAGEGAELVLKRVFGISSISPAFEVKTELEEIAEACIRFLPQKRGSFKVSCQRLWKGFELTSLEVNREIGERIARKLGLKVDLENPDVEVGIEIMEGNSYVFFEKIKGPGGLPIGVEGKLLGIVRNIDEALNALLGMRRGAEVALFCTSKEILSKIMRYSYGNRLPAKVSKDPLSEEFEGVEGVLAVPSSVEEMKMLKERYSLPIYDSVSYLPDPLKEKLIKRFSLA